MGECGRRIPEQPLGDHGSNRTESGVWQNHRVLSIVTFNQDTSSLIDKLFVNSMSGNYL
jgi:hypothetical protein